MRAHGRAKTVTLRDPVSTAVLRRAVDLSEAHRGLRAAFGRIADTIDPGRAVSELELKINAVAYEALVILRNAGRAWRTVARLPGLDTGVGLLRPRAIIDAAGGHLGDRVDAPHRYPPPFQPGWDAAASIDTVHVLSCMHWCTRRWALQTGGAIGAIGAVWVLHLKDLTFYGKSDPGRPGVWFSSSTVARRRVTVVWEDTAGSLGRGRREVSVTVDGRRFVQDLSDLDDAVYQYWPVPLTFTEPDGNCVVKVAGWSGCTICYRPDRPYAVMPRGRYRARASRANYGLLWLAGLVNVPLLTCPIEWEEL